MGQVDIKQFLGSMDLDSPPEVINPGAHRTARNGYFTGIQGNKRFNGIEGNSLIEGQDFLPDGQNLIIGRYYDIPYQRIIYLNCNSNNNHGIYIYNTLSGIFQTLIEIGANTDGDILGFIPNYPIDKIDIIYGDPIEGNL